MSLIKACMESEGRDKKALGFASLTQPTVSAIGSSQKRGLGWGCKNKFGITWSTQTRSGGTQVWAQTRDGKIINGGQNQTPGQFNPETGLSSPVKPGQ